MWGSAEIKHKELWTECVKMGITASKQNFWSLMCSVLEKLVYTYSLYPRILRKFAIKIVSLELVI